MPAANVPIIAIDGYSSCGKSTLAKALANALDLIYIDSGAMYRAVTLYVLRQGISPTDQISVEKILPRIKIDFSHDHGGNRTLLNGVDVELAIRSMDVSKRVSPIATIPMVRRMLVEQQRNMATHQGVAMDGRDIGTIVFPNAPLKLFLTADIEVRVTRRVQQLAAQGKHVQRKAIRKNLLTRDYIDATRSDSPLRKATDAVLMDNTNLTPHEQKELALTLFRTRLTV